MVMEHSARVDKSGYGAGYMERRERDIIGLSEPNNPKVRCLQVRFFLILVEGTCSS